MNEELKIKLGVNEWLELIKEDKNLNGAYISISQYIYLIEKENQELKKQLEKYKNSHYCSFIDICKSTKIANYNKQKEFIKYLEDEIERKRLNATCTTEYNDYVIPLRVILQKFKEIIGDDK